MKQIAVLLVVAVMTGCTGVSEANRHSRTTFEPMPDGSYRMTASDNPGLMLRLADHKDEWIAAYVRENGLCQKRGYSADELGRVYAGRDPFTGDSHVYHYIIRCK